MYTCACAYVFVWMCVCVRVCVCVCVCVCVKHRQEGSSMIINLSRCIRSLMKDHVHDLSKCAYSGCKQPLLSVVLPSSLYQSQLLEVKNGRNSLSIGNSDEFTPFHNLPLPRSYVPTVPCSSFWLSSFQWIYIVCIVY